MKKTIRDTITLLSVAAILVLGYNKPVAASPAPYAKAAVLIEAESGRVLYSHNADKRLPMASTTKIVTAITAIENGKLTDIVTVSSRAAGTEGSSMYLKNGEKIKLEDLLYGLMVVSGNDAAVAIAEHIGKNTEGFAALMNKTAEKAGAYDSNFKNPHGLHHPDHYTTAADLAKIAAYALRNEFFAKLVSCRYRQVYSVDGHTHWLRSKNKILSLYPGGMGVKTGYTKQAGRCLVAAAEKNGMRLLSVVLNDSSMFPDSMALLDYGYNNYELRTAYNKGDSLGVIAVNGNRLKKAELRAPDTFIYPCRTDETLVASVSVAEPLMRAPVKKGTQAGRLDVYAGDKLVHTVPLIIQDDMPADDYMFFLREAIDKFRGLYG